MGRTLATLGTVFVLLGGCGGGSGGNGDDVDPLAVLAGRWFGASFGGSHTFVIDDAGAITLVLRDGVNTGQTGAFQHAGGANYEGQLTDGELVRLYLDPTRTYAVLFGTLTFGCLQRGATTLPVAGFKVADIAPGEYVGTNLVIDAQFRVAGESDVDVSIAAGGTYAGSDSSPLTFASPAATSLTDGPTFPFGPYQDSDGATNGFIDLVPSPDLQFVASVAFPVTNGTLLNARFLGAWSRE